VGEDSGACASGIAFQVDGDIHLEIAQHRCDRRVVRLPHIHEAREALLKPRAHFALSSGA